MSKLQLSYGNYHYFLELEKLLPTHTLVIWRMNIAVT